MIISQIIGGLGNQMFQYASGRALALHRDVSLLLDVSSFPDCNRRNFELAKIFAGKFEIAGKSELRQMLCWRSNQIIRRVLRRPQLDFLRGSDLVVEPHFNFWPGFFDLPSHCYLEGYWQSENYFKSIPDVIRSDFAFKTDLSGKNEELAAQIAGTQAISLHIRRGDYVTNVKTRTILNLCPLEYYQAAIRLIAGRVNNPHFFIFSDEMPWVKSHLKIDFPCSYIDHNCGAESYNDMRLMSLCRHHIIANSSFSWWGAWLNSRSDKIVVAPKKWFANGNNVDDLIPKEWVTL